MQPLVAQCFQWLRKRSDIGGSEGPIGGGGRDRSWWRRRTGIEPASDAARRSLVLKTRGTTRNPDASAHDSTDSPRRVPTMARRCDRPCLLDGRVPAEYPRLALGLHSTETWTQMFRFCTVL